MALTDKLTAIADAIRAKAGTTDGLTLDGMVTAIEGISGGGAAGGWPEVPDDNATYLYITLPKARTSPMLGVAVNGTVTVDWGDGTEPDTLTGTSTVTAVWTENHAYAAPGNYVIRLTVDGKMHILGSSETGGSGSYLLRHVKTYNAINYVYNLAIRKVVCGENVLIGGTAFCDLLNLEECVIHNYNYNTDGTPARMFSGCRALYSFTASNNVLSIGNYSFSGCNGIRFLDFTACTSVPSLSNTYTITSIPADCEIRVPAALYDEWIAATNWSAYADYIKAY